MPNKFYVYEHWRPDDDICFYVGKGTGKRANNLKDRNSKHRLIQAILAEKGMATEVRIVFFSLTEEEAFVGERERIAFWRASGVVLTNGTGGGHGGATFTGRKHTPESLRKMSISSKGKFHSEETKKKISEKSKGRKQTKEVCHKMSRIMKAKNLKSFLGRKHTQETLDKMSQTHRKNWKLRKEKRTLENSERKVQ